MARCASTIRKHDARRYVSAIDVLRGNVDPQALRDKLVLVGMTGLATTDYQNTPLGEPMPGSEIHAQLLENVFDQTWLTRPSRAPAIELVVFVLLGLLLIWATPRWKPLNAAPARAGMRSDRRTGLRTSNFDPSDSCTTPRRTSVGLLILFSMLLV